jgi:Flp pilus assembly protein TadG
MSKRTFLTSLRDESGQSVVELAVVLPLIVVVILALVDFGRALDMYLQAEHAASDGARLAAVDYTPAGTTLANYIQQQLVSGELQTGSTTNAGAQGPAQVCISFPTTSGPNGSAQRGDPVQVTVTNSYNWIPGGIVPGSVTIRGTATMRLEQDPGFGAGCST